jgi:plasmid stabilization system protein ParE
VSPPIVLRPDAEEDLATSRDWYEQQRPGLGDRFLDACETFISRIQAMPEIYAKAFKDVRRGKLRRFPYVVYYRILNDRIEVIGILHGGRDPRTLKRRAED